MLSVSSEFLMLVKVQNYLKLFYEFKSKNELIAMQIGAKNIINDQGFRDALYLIDIGQNDLADSFTKNLSYVQVTKRIPTVITEIENAVKVSLVLFQTVD